MSNVVIFGSMNMDLTIQTEWIPQAGETIEGQGFLSNAGGKGGNQAVAAAKLGASVRMIACVGDDAFGRQLADQLGQYGVNCDAVQVRSGEQTGIAIILYCEQDNRIVLHAGTNHALKPDDIRTILFSNSHSGDIFVTQYECWQETVLEALRCAREIGMYTIFNPAPAKKIPSDIYQCIDLLVVNQTECRFLTGILPDSKAECRRAIERFHAMGAGNVVITLGEDGSITEVAGELLYVPGYRVEVVDTTAAGDAYIGALAAGLGRQWEMKACMEYATRVSAITITRQGAQQSIPYASEV